jgi:hypothetical protein
LYMAVAILDATDTALAYIIPASGDVNARFCVPNLKKL